MSINKPHLETYYEQHYWNNYISQVFELNCGMYAEFEIERPRVHNLHGITHFNTPITFINGYTLPVISKKALLKYICDYIGPDKQFFISIRPNINEPSNEYLTVSIIQNMKSPTNNHVDL